MGSLVTKNDDELLIQEMMVIDHNIQLWTDYDMMVCVLLDISPKEYVQIMKWWSSNLRE